MSERESITNVKVVDVNHTSLIILINKNIVISSYLCCGNFPQVSRVLCKCMDARAEIVREYMQWWYVSACCGGV